jgi:hypothetical protein
MRGTTMAMGRWDEGYRSGQPGQRMGRGDDRDKEGAGIGFLVIKLIIKELSTDGLLHIPYPLATACREGLTTSS